MSRFDCVIWDWNGTLIDDVRIACGAVNDILDQLGREPIDMNDYYHLMRDGMDHYYDYLFYPDKAPFEQLVVWFSKYYDNRVKTASLHSGTYETLSKLHQAGVLQTIVSSSHKDKVRRDASAFEIDEFFDEILGADDLLIKSKTERAKLYLERKGISPDRTLVVGDMIHDMETAAGIGAECVIIPKGHQSESVLVKKGAAVIKDISEVVSLVI